MSGEISTVKCARCKENTKSYGHLPARWGHEPLCLECLRIEAQKVTKPREIKYANA